VTTIDDLNGMRPLIARLSRAGRRLRQCDRDRPVVLDTAVVVLVCLVFRLPDLLQVGDADGPGPSSLQLRSTRPPLAQPLTLQAGLVLPLRWRRRSPAVTFGTAVAVVHRPVRPCSS
jgi:hypothetical protein